MGKDSKQQEGDILDEKYKGANAAVAAAGEAYYAHYWMALVGLVGGGIATYIFHKPIAKIIGGPQQIDGIFQNSGLRGLAERWSGEENHFLSRWSGKAIKGIFGEGTSERITTWRTKFKENNHGFGDDIKSMEKFKTDLVYQEKGFGFWLFDHTVGLVKPAKEWMKQASKDSEKVSLSLTSGGLLGAIGFFVAPWIYATKGVHNADQGKNQFKRAQEEIQVLREDLEFMEKRNEDLRNELRTVRDEPLSVTRDEPPSMPSDTSDQVTSQDAVILPKRKDDHALEPLASHATRHAATAGKSHSEQALAKADAEQLALGA
ncbi:MAG: hypothetical protein ACOYJ2_06820 [Rickettsiales bacterium]